jgi:hypothetical protein
MDEIRLPYLPVADFRIPSVLEYPAIFEPWLAACCLRCGRSFFETADDVEWPQQQNSVETGGLFFIFVFGP